MEDSEKLTALKKAYADIILNTAKEAAARIMVSERKAMRFQQELVSTKDEALRMLLRLKQMLDSKVKEAELTSLTQQKKIEELEAQLQEAEEIVRDVRAELREAQDELENVAKHRMHPPVDQNTEGEIAAQENVLQENRLDPYDGSVNSAPDLQFEPVAVSDTRNPIVNGINGSSNFCVSHDHTNNCYIHNPDFASIVIRRKEPELYRNGCTQRIRAFERSLFDGNMSASGNSDNLQDETLVRVHEEGKVMPVTTDAKADSICEPVKPDELKSVKENAGHADIYCPSKKRKYIRKRTLQYGLYTDKVKETNKALDLDTQCLLDNNDSSRVNSSTSNENEAQKDLMSPPFAKVPTEHKEGKVMPVTTDAKADNICEPVKPDENKGVKENAGRAEILCHRKRKYIRKSTLGVGSHSDKVKETNKALDLDTQCLLDTNDPSRVNSSTLNENEARQDLMSPPFAKVLKEHEEGKVMPVIIDAKADNICEPVKPDELKVVKGNAGHAEILCHRKRKYLRKSTLRAGLHSDKVKETNKASVLDTPRLLDNNDPSRVNSSTLNENEARQDLISPPSAKVPTDASATIEQSGSHNDTEKGDIFLKACSAWNKIKEDKELLDKSELTREESSSYKSLEVPACRTDVEAANGSSNKLDPKVSDLDRKVSCQSLNDKFLKYTFRRKRKKESGGSVDVDCPLEDSSLKKKCVEKQNGHVEPQKSCTMTESSRDSRRLAQVARQLISLSEKKWWQ